MGDRLPLKYLMNGFHYVHNLLCGPVLAVHSGSKNTRKSSVNNAEALMDGTVSILRSLETDENVQVEVWRRLTGHLIDDCYHLLTAPIPMASDAYQ
jgi:hypothetical protein